MENCQFQQISIFMYFHRLVLTCIFHIDIYKYISHFGKCTLHRLIFTCIFQIDIYMHYRLAHKVDTSTD